MSMATVTVAVPLHASRPWVENIIANVHSLPETVTQIILSDRTCLDDAAQFLESSLVEEGRVVVVAQPLGIGWAEHCQLLIEEAATDLFMIMPHDDIFLPSCVPLLMKALDAHPEALLAYGRMETVAADGVTLSAAWRPRHQPAGLIHAWKALEMIMDDQLGVPWRGLFRRREVLREGIRLLPQSAYPGSTYWGVDQLWVLAIALRGDLLHIEQTVTYKRLHPLSASTSMPPTNPGDQYKPAAMVLRKFGPGGITGRLMALRLKWLWLGTKVAPAFRKRLV